MDRRLALAAALAPALALVPGVASASGGEKKKGGGVTYIAIKAIAATILRRDGSRGVISVECGLDIPDEGLRIEAQITEPRLRAAWAEFIHGYANGLPTAAVPDADYIVRELQAATDRILKRKGARFLVGTILIN